MSIKNYPIVHRFFIAVGNYIESHNISGFQSFCNEYNLPRTRLLRLKRDPHRFLDPKWLALLVQLGYSAHWLLTGEGKMINNIEKYA